MRRWAVRLVVVLVVVGGVFALRATLFAPKPIEVEVYTVATGVVEQSVTNTKAGTVEARRRAQLSPEVGGRVVELPVAEGDRVEAGDVLLRLDDSTLEAQLTKSRRDLEAAEAQREEACLAAEQAERERGRYAELAAQNIVSNNLLDQLVARARTSNAGCVAADAVVDSAAAGISVIEKEWDKTVLRAPFDGVIAELSAQVGEWVTPSPPALPVPAVLEILDPDSIYVTAPMDEVDSAQIVAGQLVRVTLDSYPDRSVEGRVQRVAPYVLDLVEQNRTVEVEVDLLDREGLERLLPGVSADVEVILEVREGVLRIPTSALLQGASVLVVEEGVLAEREVEIGLRNWNWTEIEGGLVAGDLVVVSLDRADVQAGVEVVISDETAP